MEVQNKYRRGTSLLLLEATTASSLMVSFIKMTFYPKKRIRRLKKKTKDGRTHGRMDAHDLFKRCVVASKNITDRWKKEKKLPHFTNP